MQLNSCRDNLFQEVLVFNVCCMSYVLDCSLYYSLKVKILNYYYSCKLDQHFPNFSASEIPISLTLSYSFVSPFKTLAPTYLKSFASNSSIFLQFLPSYVNI